MRNAVIWVIPFLLAAAASCLFAQQKTDADKDRPSFEKAAALLKAAGPDEGKRQEAVQALRNCRCKAAVSLAIHELPSHLPLDPEHESFSAHLLVVALEEYYGPLAELFGPRPETTEQWADWWAGAEPLLKDDLTPIHSPAPEVVKDEFEPKAYGTDWTDLELAVSTDSRTYREGDPIRIDVSMRNISKKPYALHLPEIPTSWAGTMGWGAHLLRNGHPMLEFDTDNHMSQGLSYGGPSDWRVIIPGGTFRDKVCLQDWLSVYLDLPLPEGAYELRLTFEPSHIDGARRGAPLVFGRWDAPAVHFIIKGPTRQDLEEIVQVISEATGLKWLRVDLESDRSDRSDPAWTAIERYGDSRLTPLVKAIDDKRSDKRRPTYHVERLRPFTRKRGF